jgi:hypothetical protein
MQKKNTQQLNSKRMKLFDDADDGFANDGNDEFDQAPKKQFKKAHGPQGGIRKQNNRNTFSFYVSKVSKNKKDPKRSSVRRMKVKRKTLWASIS